MPTDFFSTQAVEHLPGAIVSGLINNRSVSFFVDNPNDAIQKYHNKCTFFEADELEILGRHIPENATYVDIGANIGNHALYIELFHRPKETILFEVNPQAIKILKLNGILNYCTSWNKDYLGYALSNASGNMRQKSAHQNNLGASSFEKDPKGAFRCITGDHALGSRRVDLIKIDVEGAEMDVLNGLRQVIDCWRPTIFVELGDYNFGHLSVWLEQNRYEIIEKFERYAGLPNFLLKSIA